MDLPNGYFGPGVRGSVSDTAKIAVFGAGGVSGYFGGRLAQAGADVRLIARGEHLEALRTD
jgi:pyruvate/2-oxoglutarate dehydrogenase complex dihydrolipoamide dehydrogenase (E3) component